MIPAVITLLTALPLTAQDIIKFKDSVRNPDIQGEIVSMSYTLVEIVDAAGIKRSADPIEIIRIIPSESRKTFTFAQGEAAMANDDPSTAILRFGRVVGDTRAPEAMRQTAEILIVRCHVATGKVDGIIRSAHALRARKPDSFYVRESFQIEFTAHLADGNLKAVSATIKAFAELANAQAMKSWIKSADLMDAMLAEAQRNWVGALGTYRKYANDPEVDDDAALGELRCLTALADWPGLKVRADALIKSSKGSRVLTAAYTARGDIEMNAARPKEALLHYLQGAMVLSRGETSPEHEAALARSSIACAKLAAAENDRAKKETLRGRAQEMFRELTATYPGSRHRAEVEKSLQESR